MQKKTASPARTVEMFRPIERRETPDSDPAEPDPEGGAPRAAEAPAAADAGPPAGKARKRGGGQKGGAGQGQAGQRKQGGGGRRPFAAKGLAGVRPGKAGAGAKARLAQPKGPPKLGAAAPAPGTKRLAAQPAEADTPLPRPPAPAARRKRRHVGLAVSFVLAVVLPIAVAAWYLFAVATDQYASHTGFTVRKEEGPSASEMLGGMFDMSSNASSDTDILYEFIQSQELVVRIDERLDLRRIWSKPEGDPVFTVDPGASVEELTDFWRRMVTIFYDGNSGLIETRVLAFDPEDAYAISNAIFEESSRMLNDLTAVARDDATRYARDELDEAVERLKEARAALTEFRARTQLVDPNADVQGQMGVLNNLQAQLAEAYIELDLLRETTRESDPRIRQAEQRIDVIEQRITEERKAFGMGGGSDDRAYATLVAEYESLIVDREFAEETYLNALANFNTAQAEAQRQSRYLAPYLRPTLPESAGYPQRMTILGLFGLFALLAWSIGALIYYSIRDRR